MKRHMGRALGLFWGSVAALLIGFALFVQIGRLALPHLSSWQQGIEYFLSSQFGLSVTFEKIDASWDGLSPEISIRDLQLIDSNTQQALRVHSALTRLDLLQSLIHLNWYFDQVEVTGVTAALSQREDGRWSLAGFSPAPANRQNLVYFDPFTALLSLNYVRLEDIELRFDFRSGRQHQISLTSLELNNDEDFHRFVAALEMPDNKEPFRLIYEGVGDPGDRNFAGQGYVQLTAYPLENSVALASESVAELVGIKDGYLSAGLWFQTFPDRSFELQGSARFERDGSAESKVPEEVVSDVTASWHPQKGWQLRLQQVQAFWQERDMEPLDLVLSGGFQRPELTLSLSELKLQPWIDFTRNLGVLPELANRILDELNVDGTLSNLQLLVPPKSPEDFRLSANLHNVSVNEWKGSPQIAGLDGYLEASAFSGSVQINSQQNFLMHYPKIYSQPFEFDSATGEVAWRVDSDNNQVLVNSGLLSMSGDLGLAKGYFYLDAPLKRGSRLSELVLQIGLQGGKVADHHYLIPEVVPESISHWVDTALVDGKVASGGFVMHSYFGRPSDEPAPPRSIQVALNVDNTELLYSEGWPELQQLSGFIQIDIPTVDAWIDRADILQAQIIGGEVHIVDNVHGPGQLVNIKSEIMGNASSGLKAFTHTPLKQIMGAAFDSWSLDGKLKGQLELAIPLSAGAAGQYQKVEAVVEDAELILQDLNLTIANLDAELSFETSKGLDSRKISGDLWQQALNATITSSDAGPSSGQWRTTLEFGSHIDFSNLATWSRRPELMFVDGLVPVTGSLTIEPGEVMFQAQSQLQGAMIDLPVPYGKTRAEKRPLAVKIPVTTDGYDLQFNYSDQVFGDLHLRKDFPVQGAISIGQALGEESPGVWLKGVINEFNGRDWWPLVDRYQAFSRQLSSDEAESIGSQAGLFNLDLGINLFNWDEWQLDDLRLSGGLLDDGWLLRLQDDRVTGDLRLFSDSRPPEIDLDYIHWPKPAPIVEPTTDYLTTEPELSAAETVAKKDLLGDFDPSSVLSFKFKVDELLLGEQDYGRWSLQVVPMENGLAVRNIVGSVRNLNVMGADGAELLWVKTEAQESTSFRGQVEGKNLDDVTDAWGLPRLMESESLSMDAAFSWRGSPVMISVNELQGDLLLNVRDGRFYQSTGQASSALLRLVGLFNFDSWARRLKFDFTDVYQGGLPFEKIDGAMKFDRGMIYLQEPLTVENTASSMKMGGSIDLEQESLDASLVATLPVGGNATFFTALAAGLPAAAGVYLVSKVFKKQMERVASVSYRMKGPWVDPEISFDKFFDSKAADKAGEKSRQEGLDRKSHLNSDSE